MKIAFANASRIWGGAEVMTARLARGLRDRGHATVVLCRPGSPFLDRTPDLTCETVPAGFDMNPVGVARAAAAIRRHRPDVLMTMTQKDPRISGVAARVVGVPVVVRHAMDVPFRTRPHHRLFYGVVPAAFVANSRATRETMLRSAHWLRGRRVEVVHNGIDVGRIESAPAAELGLPPGAFVVGYVARFETRKGTRDLVDAWPAIREGVPAAHLVMVGRGGDLEPELRARTRDDARVHWLGFRDDVASVIRAMDVLVAPSHREGFGLVVAEAMAAGTPVALARATNFPELVDDGVEGRFFEARDPASIARVVIDMAGEPAALAAMGAAGRVRARRDFSVDVMLDRYEALLASVARVPA